MAGDGGNAMNNGISCCGPRRFNKLIRRPPAAGLACRRNGAGDASGAQACERSIKNKVLLPCAARCSRRNAALRVCSCQHNSTPQLSARNICSAAHNVSALRAVRIQSSCEGGSPIALRASACGMYGGCSRTMRRCFNCCRAGASRRNSPMPCCCSSSSLRLPSGQPRPGSSADSAAWPVSMHCAAPRASCEARHSEGWIVSGACWERSIMRRPGKQVAGRLPSGCRFGY